MGALRREDRRPGRGGPGLMLDGQISASDKSAEGCEELVLGVGRLSDGSGVFLTLINRT